MCVRGWHILDLKGLIFVVKAIDYKAKSVVLNDFINLLQIEKRIRFSLYADYDLKSNGVVHKNILPVELALDWQEDYQKDNTICKDGYTLSELYKQAGFINKNSYSRKEKLQTRIKTLLTRGNCFFLTLTFTDLVLSSTSAETRRRYIARTLKEHFPLGYVANIDYGAKNGREHYHAVVCSTAQTISNAKNCIWSYGALNFKTIHTPNIQVIAKYISKLTNHAIKETTRRTAIIYSR